jgi:hypothetical protein
MGLADPPGTSRNPLAQVLELLDETVECHRYSQVWEVQAMYTAAAAPLLLHSVLCNAVEKGIG